MPEFVLAPTGSARGFRPAALSSTLAREEAFDEARAAGFAAGYAAGARRAAQEAAERAAHVALAAADAADVAARRVTDALDVLGRAAAVVRASAAPVVADATDVLHTSALELAEAVLGVELASDERSARAALTRVLAAEPGPGPVTVRLHPRDLAAVLASGAATDLVDVQLEADPDLTPGDAVAEHADGHVDARVGAAFVRARRALTDLGELR